MTLRLRASLAAPKVKLSREHTTSAAKAVTRTAWFDGKAHKTKIVAREGLAARRRYVGPAIVTEYSATTAVHPGMRFYVDAAGALVIETLGSRARK